jgi:hypothetical protein
MAEETIDLRDARGALVGYRHAPLRAALTAGQWNADAQQSGRPCNRDVSKDRDADPVNSIRSFGSDVPGCPCILSRLCLRNGSA